jgi:hypothetical protein
MKTPEKPVESEPEFISAYEIDLAHARNEKIESEAAKLSKEYGIEVDWLQDVLRKTIRNPPVGEALFPFRPSLVEALWSGLPVDRVKELFKAESLGELALKENIARYLAGPDSPFYTLDKLQEHVGHFVTWLEENKAHLVETGLPCVRFPGSDWLNLYASNLYFCKLPCRVTMSPHYTGRRQEYSYTWSRERLNSARQLDVSQSRLHTGISQYSRRTLQGMQPTVVPYEEAAYAVGISQHDGQRLDNERPTLFSIKAEVMARTHQALRDRNAKDLWNDVVSILRQELALEDLIYYLHVETELIDTILGPRVCDPMTPGEMPDRVPGGLGALLLVVSHCKAEICHRGFDRGLRLLESYLFRGLPADSELRRFDLTYQLRTLHYYQKLAALPSGRTQEHLDKWLRFMAQVDVKYKALFTSDLAGLWDSLPSFEVRVRGKRMTPQAAAAYKRSIVKFDSSFDERYDAQITDARRAIESISCWGRGLQINRFERTGDFWAVVFQGVAKSIRDLKGMSYIHFLLSHVPKSYPVVVLERLVYGEVRENDEGHTPSEGYQAQETTDSIPDDNLARRIEADMKDIKALLQDKPPDDRVLSKRLHLSDGSDRLDKTENEQDDEGGSIDKSEPKHDAWQPPRHDALDEKAIAECNNELLRLQEELDTAKQRGGIEKVAEIDGLIRAIRNELNRNIGPGYRSRDISFGETEPIRSRVRKAVDDAKAAIGKDDFLPELRRHLDQFLKIDENCYYQPPPEVTWMT